MRTLATGLAVFIFFVALTLAFPSILMNDLTLAIGKKLIPKGYATWKNGALSAESADFLKKNIYLALENACVDLPSVALKGCFPVFDVSFQLDFGGGVPSLSGLGPVRVVATDLLYRPVPSSEPPPPATEEDIVLAPPEWLLELNPRAISVEVENGKIEAPGVRAAIKIRFTAANPVGMHLYHLQANGGIALGEGKDVKDYAVSVNANLSKSVSQGKRQWLGTADLEAKESATQALELHASLLPLSDKLSFTIKGESRAGESSIFLKARGTGNPREVESKVTVAAAKPIPEIGKIALPDCEFRWGAQKTTDTFHLACPLQASLTLSRASQLPPSRLMKKLDGNLNVRLSRRWSGEHSGLSGDFKVALDPVFSDLKDGVADIRVNAEGNLRESPSRWKYSLDSSLRIAHLKRFSTFLAKTAWAVPVPLNALDGSLKLRVQGEKKAGDETFVLPVTLTTNFSSDRQKLDLNVHGKVTLKELGEKGADINADVLLTDVQLVLPPLNPYGIPQLVPDDRFVRRPGDEAPSARQVAATTAPVNIHLNIRTGKEKPLRFISTLTEEKIPIALDLKVTPETPVTGRVEILPFSLELFRRNARVQSMQIRLREDPDLNEVHGRIQVIYVDYTITALVDGPLSHPAVHFVSDPPLSDKQVVAVLLFGRSFDVLDAEELESVGSARDALADGAIGLASMYALASTPVESIGYEASTKTFSAKIKIAENTSVTVGSDFKDRKILGLRRKLESHWEINTYLENPFLAAQRSFTTFLEWNWRY